MPIGLATQGECPPFGWSGQPLGHTVAPPTLLRQSQTWTLASIGQTGGVTAELSRSDGGRDFFGALASRSREFVGLLFEHDVSIPQDLWQELWIVSMRQIAVLFRVHYWNDSVRARYETLCKYGRGADVWVVVDDTNGVVELPESVRSFRITGTQATDIRLANYPPDSLFYYNADYPLYLFYVSYNYYDYYVICEYDVEAKVAIGDICEYMKFNDVDFLAMPNRISKTGWSSMLWSCTELYSIEDICPHLVCFCAFSNAVGGLSR